MTERALFVRQTFTPDGRYAAIAVEHAAARVFDTVTRELVSECSVKGAREMPLTAVALASVGQLHAAPMLAIGTGNGRVLLHDCGRDTLVANIAVADSAVAVADVVFHRDVLVALTRDGRLSVYRAGSGTPIATRLRTGVNGAASVAIVDQPESGAAGALLAVVASSAECQAVLLPDGGAADGTKLDVVCSFHGHTDTPNATRAIPGEARHAACFTATFTDGNVRLWNLARTTPAGARIAPEERCCAVLAAGHRLVGLTVFSAAASEGAAAPSAIVVVAATTVTGELLIWRLDVAAALGGGVASGASAEVGGTAPRQPHARFSSAAATGRFLAGLPVAAVAEGGGAVAGTSSAGAADALRVDFVTVRGRWAVPSFQRLDAETVNRAFARMRGAVRSGNVAAGGSVATRGTVRIPFSDDANATAPSAHIVLNEKKLRKMPRLTKHGATIAAGQYDDAPIPLAKSVDHLPFPHDAVARRAAGRASEKELEDVVDEEEEDARQEQVLAALSDRAAARSERGGGTSGVVVLLHQALHASDATLVTELLMVAARSHADMCATVRGLQLAYLAQLLRILAARLVNAGTTSPLHGWIFVILEERGPELRAAIKAAEHHDAAASSLGHQANATTTNGAKAAGQNDVVAVGRAVKAILTPVLERYRRLTELQNSLSVMHGRASVFLAARPSKTKTGFLTTLQEPSQPWATKVAAVTAADGESGDEDEEDEEGSDADAAAAVAGRRNTRNRGRKRNRGKTSGLVAAEVDDDDDDDGGAVGALDDGESDEQGDDGSSVYDDGADGSDEEGGLADDDDTDFDDGLDDEFGDYGDNVGHLLGDEEEDDGDLDLGVEEGEEEDEDLAPSDDVGSAAGSRGRRGRDDDDLDSDEEGEDSDDDDDADDGVGAINSRKRNTATRQLTVDNEGGDSDDDG